VGFLVYSLKAMHLRTACFLLVALATCARIVHAEAPVLTPQIIEIYPHDSSAFTQGLSLRGEEVFESTGLLGESTLRRSDLVTGMITQSVALPPNEFGEGLALVDARLIQLTYENQLAHVYDASSLEEVGLFHYEGQGWGLCYDGKRLIMSDGTDKLVFRDPESFEVTGSVAVHMGGLAYSQLNELECVDGEVWANVFPTNFIVRIDPKTGEVLARIDCSGLLSDDDSEGAGVLNGIAFDETSKRFLLTGKMWPKLFMVTGLRPEEDLSEQTTPSCSTAPCPGTTLSGGALLCMLTLLQQRRRAADKAAVTAGRAQCCAARAGL
jgi:glutaminyl-peptide cyclotransferase